MLIEHYGNIPHRAYDEQSAAIEDLLRELAKDELAQIITDLGLRQWYNYLAADNDAFMTLRAMRVTERAAEPKARMSDLRLKTDSCYRNIVMHIEYTVKAGKATANMKYFIAEMNELVKSYKEVLAHKKHKKVISD